VGWAGGTEVQVPTETPPAEPSLTIKGSNTLATAAELCGGGSVRVDGSPKPSAGYGPADQAGHVPVLCLSIDRARTPQHPGKTKGLNMGFEGNKGAEQSTNGLRLRVNRKQSVADRHGKALVNRHTLAMFRRDL